MSILDLSYIRQSPYRCSSSVRNSPRCTSRTKQINNLTCLLQKPFKSSKNTPEETQKLKNFNRIRNRNKKKPEAEITPELAVHVVKKYLLPMFESDSRKKAAHSRIETYGLNRSLKVHKDDSYQLFPSISCSPTRPQNNTTVLHELKLSEQLMSDLNDLREELTRSEMRVKSAEQDKMSVTKEQDLLMNKHLELATFCESLKISNENDRRESQKTELKYSLLTTQNIEYKKMCRDLKKQTDELKHKLQDEKVANDQLKDTKIQLEHGNSLLTMENQIMGEMLKTLYETIGSLTGVHSIPAKLTQEYFEIVNNKEMLMKYFHTLEEQVLSVVSERDAIKAESEYMISHRLSLINEKDWIHKTYKQQITSLQKDLQDANDSRTKLSENLNKLELAHRNLNVEYKVLLKRMRSMKMKKAAYNQLEEKQCKNCAKLYLENENYNWSCRNHHSSFSGEIWWCCGKSNKDAPGCKVSKHDSKDDDSELFETGKSENSKFRSNICSSCRGIGHSPHECPKDPNAKNTIDYQEELNRLHKIDKTKKASKSEDYDIKFKAMDLVAYKLNNSGFVQETLSDISDSEERTVCFNDIEGFKKVSENEKAGTRIRVDEMMTKELQREASAFRSKLSANGSMENLSSIPNRSSSRNNSKIESPRTFFFKVSNI